MEDKRNLFYICKWCSRGVPVGTNPYVNALSQHEGDCDARRQALQPVFAGKKNIINDLYAVELR